jgi:hypothetical protein
MYGIQASGGLAVLLLPVRLLVQVLSTPYSYVVLSLHAENRTQFRIIGKVWFDRAHTAENKLRKAVQWLARFARQGGSLTGGLSEWWVVCQDAGANIYLYTGKRIYARDPVTCIYTYR